MHCITVSPTNVWHWSRSWSLLSQDFRVLPCFGSMTCHPSKLPLPHKQEATTYWNRIPSIFICQDESHCQISLLLGDTVGMAFKQPTNQIQACKTPKYPNIIFLEDKKSDLQHAMAPCPAPIVVQVFLEAVMVQVPQAVVAWRAQLIWRSPQPEGSHQLAPGGKIMEIDDNLMTLMTLSIVIIHKLYLPTIHVPVWFKMDVLDVRNCHVSTQTNEHQTNMVTIERYNFVVCVCQFVTLLTSSSSVTYSSLLCLMASGV